NRRAQDGVIRVLEPEPVVLLLVVPLDELHDDVDALSLAHARHTEQILDVEHAEPADLDVMPEQIGGSADDPGPAGPAALDHDVGDEAVAAEHELERALALADAALAKNEHAHPVDVDEDSVQRRGRSESIVEHGVERVDGAARSALRDEERRAGRFGGDDER